MHSTQFRNDEGRERMGKRGGRKKDEDKRWLERRKVGRKQLPMDRKGKSSLPGSIEAGRKDVREARHVLPSVKSIPVKERKTRESGPSLAVLLLFRFWVDRSITTKGTTVKSRSVHDVSLTICSLDNETLRFQVNGTGFFNYFSSMNDLEKNSILITLRNESYEILSPFPTVSPVSVSVFYLCSLYIPAMKMY